MAQGSLITNEGWKIIQNRAYKATPDYTAPSLFRVGVENDTPTKFDTALDREVPIAATESVDACDATTGWTASTDGAVSLNNTRFKEGTGSLSVAKPGATINEVSISKTTTSRDFTDKTLWFFVYIESLSDLIASGTAVSIQFGSDSSNYYVYSVDISDLSAGWNTLSFTSATATSTVGTPDILLCDYTNVIFYTPLFSTTVAADRFLVDDIKLASSGDYKKLYEATYPLINETDFEVTTRGKLLTTDANGMNINVFSLWNTDATPKLHSIDVFTAESKEDTDEFIFESVDRRTI